MMENAELSAANEELTDMKEGEKLLAREVEEQCAKPSVTENDDVADALGPYSYLERDSYTTEIYKVELHNFPPRAGIGQLRKRLNSLGVKPSKIKIIEKSNFAFINFRSEEDRQDALRILPGHKWKGRSLTIKKANPAADPWLKKKQEATQAQAKELENSSAGPEGGKRPAADAVSEDSVPAKKSRVETENSGLPVGERLNDIVSPLWRKPYEAQLKIKENEMKKYLKKLCRGIESNNSNMTSWLATQRTLYAGLCCKLNPIKPSPVLDHYRNKCEFTVGRDSEGTDKVVGFCFGQYKNGEMTVGEPSDVILVPGCVKAAVKVVQDYIQSHSSYGHYEPESKSGHWRTITARTNLAGHVMVICGFHPQKLSKENLLAEEEKLKQFMREHSAVVSSVYFAHQGNPGSGQVEETHHLVGDKVIEETLLGMKFQISPGAFFQINTRAAEVLYSTIRDYCAVTSDTILVDICCGTGTIGLSMARDVSRVIGVEMCVEAVRNATENATLNGVKNAEFHCGQAEKVLPGLLPILPNTGVVAVADPPRAGLHSDVIRALRRCSAISRLVYVSCNPAGAQQNLIDLTRAESKKYKGAPFTLQEAVPVDLFPHTEHCELVLLLQR